MESLQAKLDAIRERVEGGMSAQFLKIMHGATTRLEESGLVDSVLKAGVQAPAFDLKNQKGERVSSEEMLKAGPVVITFYRGFW